MNQYQHPDVDTDVSGYRAVVTYSPSDAGRLVLPGWHDSYASAEARATKVAKAMAGAGESGAQASVGWSGQRPAGMPKNAKA